MRVTPILRSDTGSAVQFFVGDTDSLSTSGYTSIINSPDVAACIGKIAGITSGAPIHLMRNTKQGDVRVKNELSRFMDISPYSMGTRATLVEWIVQTMLATGNSVLMPVTSGGYLSDLKPMPGASPIGSADGLSYRIYWRGHYYDPANVLHFVYNPALDQPWRGRGVTLQLKDVLGNLKQAAATTKGFLSDKWKPSVIVKVDALADEFDSAAGRDRLIDQYMSNQEAGKPWVVPSELMDIIQVKPLSLADLAINDSVQLDKRAVAAAFGVPPYVVGIGAFNTDEYNNFVRTTIRGKANILQQELTKKLLLSPELYFKFNTWKLYSYDLKTLAQVADDQYIRGIMSGNEARDWLELSPVDGLDERVILENFIPAGMIGDQKKLTGGNNNGEN